jgi:hypothetical protein
MTAAMNVFANLASLIFAVGSSTVEIWELLQKVIRMYENKDLRKSLERCHRINTSWERFKEYIISK